jgi:hypothetical protein
VIERFQGRAIRMEVAGARPEDTLHLSLGFARGADITVVLVAHWYGSIVPRDQGGDGERSYTWYEAQTAKQAGKALLVYLLDSKVPWNPEYIEGSTSLPRPITATGKSTKQMLAEFRAWLKTEAGVTVAEFKDEATLRVQLGADLTRWMNALPTATQAATSVEPAPVLWNRPDCPCPGLAAYDEDGELLYAGREAPLENALATIRQRLHQPGLLLWIQVEGASGAGKSSFALAGLLSRLRALASSGAIGRLRIARMRPETDPGRNLAKAISHALPDRLLPGLEALAAQLLDTSGNGLVDLLDQQLAPVLPGNQGPPERLVLLIDQFGELFTHDPGMTTPVLASDANASVSTRFGAMLAKALSRGNRLLLITTIRRDYLEELGHLPALDQLMQGLPRRGDQPSWHGDRSLGFPSSLDVQPQPAAGQSVPQTARLRPRGIPGAGDWAQGHNRPGGLPVMAGTDGQGSKGTVCLAKLLNGGIILRWVLSSQTHSHPPRGWAPIQCTYDQGQPPVKPPGFGILVS